MIGELNAYEIAIGSGVIILAGWLVAYILCWVGQWAWAWVDDSKAGENNLIVKLILEKIFEFKFEQNPGYKYVKDIAWVKGGKKSEYRELYVFKFCFMTASIPLFIVLTLDFYYVALTIASISLLAILARFARRHKKLFDKHIVDKEAHK